MFKCMFALVFVVVFINHAHSSGIAESYQQVNLGKRLGWGLDRGLDRDDKLISVLQQPILISKDELEPKLDYVAYPEYGFKYGVSDPKTGDRKEQSEVRDGDVVKGEYSLIEADGTKRTVKYVADKKSGFNAEVIRSGHAVHPQIITVKKLVELPSKDYSWGY